jgi:hypothetical protein
VKAHGLSEGARLQPCHLRFLVRKRLQPRRNQTRVPHSLLRRSKGSCIWNMGEGGQQSALRWKRGALASRIIAPKRGSGAVRFPQLQCSTFRVPFFFISAALLAASLVWSVSPTYTRPFIPTKTTQMGECGTFPNGPAVDPKGVCPTKAFDNKSIVSSFGPAIPMPVAKGGYAGQVPHWSVAEIPASFAMDTISLHRKYPSPSFMYERNAIAIPLKGIKSALSLSGCITYRDDRICTIDNDWSTEFASLATADNFFWASTSAALALSESCFAPSALSCAVPAAAFAASAWVLARPAAPSADNADCSARPTFPWRSEIACDDICEDIIAVRSSPAIPTISTMRDSFDHLCSSVLSFGMLVNSAMYSPMHPKITSAVEAYPAISQKSSDEDNTFLIVHNMLAHQRRERWTLLACLVGVIGFLCMQLIAYVRDFIIRKKAIKRPYKA